MIKRQTTLFDGDCDPMDEEQNRETLEKLKANLMNFTDRLKNAKDDDMMSMSQSIQFSSSSASQDGVERQANDADADRETGGGFLGGLMQGLFDNFRLDDDVLNELMESNYLPKLSDRSIDRGNINGSDYVINHLPEDPMNSEVFLKKVSHHFLSQSSTE